MRDACHRASTRRTLLGKIRAMKKRLLIVCGLCAVVAVSAILLRPRDASRLMPSRELLARMFPDDSRQVFENADSMTLYAITDDMYAVPEHSQKFRDFYVVGKAEITDKKTRAALFSQLEEDVEIGEQARYGRRRRLR